MKEEDIQKYTKYYKPPFNSNTSKWFRELPQHLKEENHIVIGYLRWLWVRKRNVVKLKKVIDRNGNLVEFKITFEEWCEIFLEDNNYERYGSKLDDLCLSRNDDLGNYEYGNVKLVTNKINNLENRYRCYPDGISKEDKKIITEYLNDS